MDANIQKLLDEEKDNIPLLEFRYRIGINIDKLPNKPENIKKLLYKRVRSQICVQRVIYYAAYWLILLLSFFQTVLGVAITVLTPTKGHQTAITILGGFTTGIAAISGLVKALKWSEKSALYTAQLRKVRTFIERGERDIICHPEWYAENPKRLCKAIEDCHACYAKAKATMGDYVADAAIPGGGAAKNHHDEEKGLGVEEEKEGDEGERGGKGKAVDRRQREGTAGPSKGL